MPDRNNTQLPNGGNNRQPSNDGNDGTKPPQGQQDQDQEQEQEQDARQIGRSSNRNKRLSKVKGPNHHFTNRVQQVKKGSQQNNTSKIRRSAKLLVKPTFQRIQSKLSGNHTAITRFDRG